MTRGAILGAALLLGACAGGAPGPMPLAASGPVEVVVQGQSFIADLQPGPVLTISRDAGFANDEGKLAKDVAQQFCASRQRQVSPLAFGQFAGGVWVFNGACA